MNNEITKALDALERLMDCARELRKAGVSGSAEFSATVDQIYNTLADIEMVERGAVATKVIAALQRSGQEIPAELRAEIAEIQSYFRSKT